MRHTGDRSVRLSAIVLGVSMLAALVPGVAGAQESAFDPATIVFPVIGPVHFTDTFGAPRSGGRSHEAIDIMADKMQPVVAPADGVVGWIGSSCCYFEIDHGGGWSTWYIHLNNDTPGTDDGQGWGIADGLVTGTPVVTGQVIGWVGDSGNAEWTGSHLHFEIRKDGVAINPYEYLLAAPRLSEANGSPIPVEAPVKAYSGQFQDDEGSVHEADIDRLFEAGITRGCTEAGDFYCPTDHISRGEMAAFIRRSLDLPAIPEADYYPDDDGSQFEDDIDAITYAGIGFGCADGAYCPDTPLLREEMAELLVRAFGYTNPDTVDFFDDDDGSTFESSINALKAAGITKGCDASDPGRFCPERHLSRAEMASFFVRSLGL